MKRILGGGSAVLALTLVWNAALAQTSGAVASKDFLVFDAFLYQHKPDLAPLGMRQIVSMNQPAGILGTVDDEKTRATLIRVKDYKGMMFLDYEAWELTGLPAQVIAHNVQNHIRVAEIARETAPNATFGFYGILPCRDYWGQVSHNVAKINDWKECNRQGEAIAQHVDVIFPSLYTFYNDQKSWDIYARGMIEQARRYKKPVYVFLWPEYHPSNALLGGTNLSAEFWRHELEFCRGLADGIVIWGGFQEPWREEAPWWLEDQGVPGQVEIEVGG